MHSKMFAAATEIVIPSKENPTGPLDGPNEAIVLGEGVRTASISAPFVRNGVLAKLRSIWPRTPSIRIWSPAAKSFALLTPKVSSPPLVVEVTVTEPFKYVVAEGAGPPSQWSTLPPRARFSQIVIPVARLLSLWTPW